LRRSKKKSQLSSPLPEKAEEKTKGGAAPPESSLVLKVDQTPKNTPSLKIELPEEPEKTEKTEDKTELPEESFTEAVLFEKWDEYFEKKKGILADHEAMILRKKPVLKEHHVLEISIKNGVEINVFKKLEEELVSYLKKELCNNKISIRHVQAEKEEEENLYTDVDKFNDMAKRNPVLLKLKDRLGLDPDY